MKKNLFSIVFVLCILSPNLNAQDSLSHWSLGVKGGLDYYRVSPVSSKSGASQYIDDMGWTFPGIFVEYTINPLVGFGGSVDYLTYDRNTAKGNILDFSVFGSVNLANLLTPRRTDFWKKVNIYGNWGAGLGYFSTKIKESGANHSLVSPLVTSALNVEYKLSDSWALCAEAQYRYYFREDLGGMSSSYGAGGAMNFGNDALAATIGVRYKFGAKSKKHVRNMSIDEYNNQPEKNDLVTQKRLAALEVENALNKEKMQKMQDDLKTLKDSIEAEKLRLQNDLKNYPQAQVVDNNSESIDVLLDVNFDFDSYELTPKAKSILDHVALVLKANKTWNNLLISGHTDNVGSDMFNKKLSLDRAEIAKKYLISKGISDSVIKTIGLGEINPKASNATKEGRYINRRAEFILNK